MASQASSLVVTSLALLGCQHAIYITKHLDNVSYKASSLFPEIVAPSDKAYIEDLNPKSSWFTTAAARQQDSSTVQ